MGYGVKVAQQILILFVKVRILVTQQKRTGYPVLFFIARQALHTNYWFYYVYTRNQSCIPLKSVYEANLYTFFTVDQYIVI